MKSPFKFLDSYTIEDQKIFFGRDQEITELYRRIFERKILLVYGVSGTGKSSLVNCGLASMFDDSDWLPLNIRRGSNIAESLNEALKKEALTPFRKDQSINEKIQSVYLNHFKPVYLIFDQFEELFIFGTREERTDFIELLKEIVGSNIKCRVVLIIREEFLAGITDFEYDLPEIFSNRFRVEKMKRANAILAVEGPCRINLIETEEGFPGELLDRLSPAGNEIELTFLQIYLDRIFRIAIAEKKDTDNIRFSKELLTRAGNVSDLLGQFLEEQIGEFEDQDTSMAILKSFVSVQGTRRQITEDEILDAISAFGITLTEPELLKYLTRLVDLRILRERDEAGRFELRHDALAAKIYESFTAIEKDIIEVKQFMDNAWHSWQKRAVLLSASDLEYIAPYESRLYLSKELSGLIEKSKSALIRTKRRRRNIAVIAAVALLVMFAGFTIWALNERGRAFAQSHRSRVLLLISKAREANFSNPTKAIRYAQIAFKYDSTNALANQTISDIFHATESKPFYAFSLKHNDDVTSAVFSPDGKNILTASRDNTVKLWDLTGKCLLTLSGHSSYKNTALFSPDGKRILTASVDNKAKLWDLSGKCLVTFSGHTAQVISACFSPDGRSILTSSSDKTAKLWDLSGKCIATFSGHKSAVEYVLFSPDGRNILTASDDGTIKLWDLSEKCLTTLSGMTNYWWSAVFSPDGRSILTASEDGTVKLWDLSGKCLVNLSGHSSVVLSAVFSADGRNILTASQDNTAKLWDLSGKCLATLSGHSAFVLSAVFSPDGRNILTSSGDNTAKLWDLSGQCIATLSGHTLLIWSAVFSPDGKNILTASRDVTAKLWDLSGKCLVTLSENTFINSAVFSHDGKNIITASDDKTAKLWDRTGKCLVVLSGHKSGVISSLFSPDGKDILTASYDNTAKLWDLSGKCLVTFSGHASPVISAVFSSDGKNILTASGDSTSKLWNLSGKCLVTLSGHTSSVISAFFSSDGNHILTSSLDNTAKLWDLSGKCLANLPAGTSRVFKDHSYYSTPAVFSPDGLKILTIVDNNRVKLWDLSGKCLATFPVSNSNVWTAVFSPDGKNILTGSDDYKAKLWDLSGRCLTTFSGHTSIVISAVFSPDGRNIITTSDDYTAKLWDLSGKCYATLSGHTAPVWSSLFSPDSKNILTVSWDNTVKLWQTPSSIYKWLGNAKIGFLSPADKFEIDEVDNIKKLQSSDDLSMITEYADWYLSINDTAKAEILYERAMQLNRGSFDKNILGNIYKYQNKKDKYLALYKDEPQEPIKQDLSALRDTSAASNYYGKYLFFSERAKLFERLLLMEPEAQNKILAASNYNDVGWYGLLAKEYNAALKAIQRGIELDSINAYLHTNLPLCYLLTGQYEKAKSVYYKYKDKPWTTPGSFKTFKDVFLADLTTLESEGISNPDFEKVKELLKK